MLNAFKFVEKLERAGFSKELAKASVEGWIELMDQNFATKADFKEYYFTMKEDLHTQNFAFKSELQELRTEIKSEIQELRTEFKTEIQELRTEVKTEIQELRSEIQAIELKLVIKLTGVISAVAGIHLIIYGMIK